MKKGLSSNFLKIFAAVCMVVDHIGLMFFPSAEWMRIIGRFALPIFAFFISEGCVHTKNRLKYFSLTFGLGTICQIVYFIALKSLYMCILITFSLAILITFSYLDLKNAIYRGAPFYQIAVNLLLLLSAVSAVWVLNEIFVIDYGFFGCLMPLFFAIATKNDDRIPLIEKNKKTDLLSKFDCLPVRLLLGAVPIILIAERSAVYYYYALFALLVLLFYSGERGKFKMKYFFYIFYPLHLVILQGISLII